MRENTADNVIIWCYNRTNIRKGDIMKADNLKKELLKLDLPTKLKVKDIISEIKKRDPS